MLRVMAKITSAGMPEIRNCMYKLFSSASGTAPVCKQLKGGKGSGGNKGGNKGGNTGGNKGGSAKKGVQTPKKGKNCGKPKAPPAPKKKGPMGGNYIMDPCDVYDTPRVHAEKWRKVSYFLVPMALGFSVFVIATKGNEDEDLEFMPYDYLYIRTKSFCWRDHKKSLFHGPNNFIPEDEMERINQEERAEGEPKYKSKKPDERQVKLELREKHAKEELERRQARHEQERAATNPSE